MSDLVGNPEDPFSRDEDQIAYHLSTCPGLDISVVDNTDSGFCSLGQ